MIYYKSSELADYLKITSSKWKRWAREFLPPDALGGFQSGFARQFSVKDAFRVFLGGTLVCALRFNITEAKRILSDLNPWLKAQGFYSLRPPVSAATQADRTLRLVYIHELPKSKFAYVIRSLEQGDNQDRLLGAAAGPLELIAADCDPLVQGDHTTARVLNISRLYGRFLACLTPRQPPSVV